MNLPRPPAQKASVAKPAPPRAPRAMPPSPGHGEPTSERPEPGTPMQFQWRKWDGGEHWNHVVVYLGQDEHGDWLGQPARWPSQRPGRRGASGYPGVILVPHSADFAFTANAVPKRVRVYIDVGWDVRWSEDPLLVEGIDMDLDVVKTLDSRGTFVDDRDEWELHSAAYGYPADVMALLERRTEWLLEQVTRGIAPFDDATMDAWLERLAQVVPPGTPPPQLSA